MCHIYARQSPEAYSYVSRSVRLNGYCTSIKIEAKFWRVLEDIAREEGVALSTFLATLHDEAQSIHGEVRNFASLLRCTCLVHLSEKFERSLAGAPGSHGTTRSVPLSDVVPR